MKSNARLRITAIELVFLNILTVTVQKPVNISSHFKAVFLTQLCGALAPSAGGSSYLLAVVSDRGQDSAERLEAHGDVQQMSSKEEVVEVSKNGHGGVPDQVQEVLQENKQIN